MVERELIERRQYAERVLSSLNIRPFKVDLLEGLLMVPRDKVKVVRKICKSFGWPLVVSRLR